MKRLALTLLTTLPIVAGAETVTIAADNWYPMNGEPGASDPGFMIELAEKALAMQDMTVDYQLMPWERAIQTARKGNIDCIVGAYPEDAPDFVFGKEPYGTDDSYFFVKQGASWSYQGIDSLTGQKVGIILGYAYDDEVDSWLQANGDALSGDDALPKNIKKLMAGRIDAIIDSKPVVEAQLKEMGLSGQIVTAGIVGETTGLYIACTPNSDKSQKIVDALDAGITSLREAGEVESIMNKYGLKDWK